MKTIRFTAADLEYLKDQARKYWLDMNPEMKLPDSTKGLTESELLGLSWLRAASDLLLQKGLGTGMVPELHEPSTEPDTEY